MSSRDFQAIQPTLARNDSGLRRSVSRPQPRSRPVLSCLRCRHRKIKCDRRLPCKQCTLTSHERQCSYNARPKPDEAGGPTTRNGSPSSRLVTNDFHTDLSHHSSIAISTESYNTSRPEMLAALQERVRKLERFGTTNYFPAMKTPNSEKDCREGDDASPKVDAALSIKPSGPKYHSQSYKKSLLHHVRRVSRIMICF